MRLRPTRRRPVCNIPLPGDGARVLYLAIRESQVWDEYLSPAEALVYWCMETRHVFGAPSHRCQCEICHLEERTVPEWAVVSK